MGKPNGRLDDAIPKIGAFEELVGAVCPQAFLWQREGPTKAKEAFLEKILSYTTLEDITANTVCAATTEGDFSLFDELTGRFILSGSADAFHFGAPVVYMPSFMEVFVWSKFKLSFEDWMGGVDLDDSGMKSLIMIKMRYVSQLAEARAESEVLSINSRPIAAADCLDDPEANNAGSQASVAICNQEECSICAMLSALLSITQECDKCTAGGHAMSNLPMCDTCRTQMKELFAKLNAACVGKCEDSIIGSYLCTAATSGMGGQASCSMLDAVSYMVGYLPFGEYDAKYGASGYYGYYGSTVSSMAYKSGVSLGYGASAFNYDDACYSGYGRRLSHDSYGSCGRRLSGMASRRLSNTGNRRLAEVYEAHGWGNFKTAVDFKPDLDGGTALLEALKTGVVADATTASILSKFLGEILTPDNDDTGFGGHWLKHVISMVAQNVHFISAAWANIGVPVSVTCDPDFEESAVRDALKLVSTHDGCPVPHTFHGSSQAAFLNAAWKGGFASSIWSG